MKDTEELTHERLTGLDLDADRILIEAGAGTGKTYLLASLHLKLILAGHAPREIGAVTFTNAATEELRGRLRGRLRAALRGLDGNIEVHQEPWWPLVETACTAEGSNAVLRRLRAALAGMDEAPIHTIHGLCLRLLRRHPGAVDVEPALEPDADDRLEQAAQDFWRRHVVGDTIVWEAFAGRGLHTPDDLAGILRRTGRRDPLPWPDAPEVVEPERLETLREALRSAVEEELDALITGLLERQSYFVKKYFPKDTAPEDAFDDMAQAAHAWLDGGGRLPERLTRERLQNGLRKRGTEATTAWLAGFRLPDLAADWNALLEALARHRMHQALATLPEAAARLRQEAGELSPDDLLELTFTALDGNGGDGLARAIAAELPFLLVDEFQDTDALQYGILKKLEAAGVRLILIGDPKQAIYGFRGADVHTYLRAKADTPAARRFLLTRNHRSRPAVCAAVNRLFDGDYPFAWQGLGHPPAVAAGTGESGSVLALPADIDPAPDAGLTLFPLGEGQDAYRSNKDEARDFCAESCARHIAALLAAARDGRARLGEAPIEARHLAVLARGHDQAEAVRAALARYRIPSAYTSRQSVFDTEAARSLLAWIEALAEPENPARLRAALADPLTGMDLPALRHALDDDWEDWLDHAADLHQLWRRHGVLAAVLRLLEMLEPVTLARREDGERLLTDLLHLAELLQSEAVRHPEPAALARWFRNQVEAPTEGEENILRLEDDRNAVRILTIHKAKGLEFPIVYLPFLWSATPVNGNRLPHLFHDGDRWRIAFDKDDQALALADRERLSEDLRLLYVALTRARTKLFAWAGAVGQAAGRSAFDWILYPEHHEAVASDGKLFETGSFGKNDREATLSDWQLRLKHLADENVCIAEYPPEPAARAVEPPETEPLQLAPLPPRVDDPWRITSYSGILRGEHRAADYDADEDERLIAWSGVGREYFPPGAATGNFLHRLLEETDYTRPDWQTRRAHIDQLRLRYGLPAPEGWWPRLVEWMDGVLSAPLPEGGRLADIVFTDRLHEALFHFRVRGAREAELNTLLREHGMEPLEQWVPGGRLAGLLTGAVDLIYRREGRYYIADFKSNLLPDYGPARLRQAMLERRYDLQYLLYATALHRHLKLRLPDYDYDAHFGGVRYLFLRGMHPDHPGQGIFDARPPRALIEGFDALLEGGM